MHMREILLHEGLIRPHVPLISWTMNQLILLLHYWAHSIPTYLVPELFFPLTSFKFSRKFLFTYMCTCNYMYTICMSVSITAHTTCVYYEQTLQTTLFCTLLTLYFCFTGIAVGVALIGLIFLISVILSTVVIVVICRRKHYKSK